jgi:hypothetical protein
MRSMRSMRGGIIFRNRGPSLRPASTDAAARGKTNWNDVSPWHGVGIRWNLKVFTEHVCEISSSEGSLKVDTFGSAAYFRGDCHSHAQLLPIMAV